MIKSLLNEQTVRVYEQAQDWREAVALGCQPLIEQGHIEPSYVDAIYKSHEEIGPYYVVGPNIAMPHARPEDGVNQMSLGLTIIKNGVNFGSQGNDPVRLLFTLAAVDSNSHVELISQLAELFMNEDDIHKLCECNNVKSVLEITQKY